MDITWAVGEDIMADRKLQRIPEVWQIELIWDKIPSREEVRRNRRLVEKTALEKVETETPSCQSKGCRIKYFMLAI